MVRDVWVCHCGGFPQYTESYQVYPIDVKLGPSGNWWSDRVNSLQLKTIWNESSRDPWGDRRTVRTNTPAIKGWELSSKRKFKMLSIGGKSYFI